ncbi:hypothetical protein, partial [Hymenobacter coccineus]|uniref:hypothetical protein n=1 Tax=Hymenobacter coccineus TaxID=1908235 RepID=UPI001955D597
PHYRRGQRAGRAPWGPHLAPPHRRLVPADPLAPGTGLGLWIAGRLAQGLGVRLGFAETGTQLCATVAWPAPGPAA